MSRGPSPPPQQGLLDAYRVDHIDAKRQPAPVGKLWYVPEDAPTLQAALDVAAPHDGIFVAAGVYEFSEPLLVHKPVHIIGVDDVGHSAVLRFRTQETYMSSLRISCSEVRVKGITLEMEFTPATAESGKAKSLALTAAGGGGGAVSHSATNVMVPLDPRAPRSVGVLVSPDVDNVVFDECVLRAVGMHGVFLSGGSYVTFICCNVSSNVGCAVYCDGRVYAERCDFRDSAVGIVVSQNATVHVKASCVHHCHEGIVVDGHGFVDVNTCVFSECRVGLSAFAELPPPKSSVVRGCEFVDCELSGIAVDGREGALDIGKCYFHGVMEDAVTVLNGTTRLEIRANAFKLISGIGVRVWQGAPIIECNAFDGCETAGIWVDSSRPTVRLNELMRCARGGAGRMPPATKDVSGSLQQGMPAAAIAPAALIVNGELVARRDAFTLTHAAAVDKRSASRRKALNTSNANPVLASRGATATQTALTANFLLAPPDPHVEGNLFAENGVNVRLRLAIGTYVKNELLSSLEESVVVEGVPDGDGGGVSASVVLPEVPSTFSDNELRGSVASHIVLCLPGAFATFASNDVSHAARGYGFYLDTTRFVEVRQNSVSSCQGGVLGRGVGAQGKIIKNDLHGTSLYIQLDAVPSMYVSTNVNVADAADADDRVDGRSP